MNLRYINKKVYHFYGWGELRQNLEWLADLQEKIRFGFLEHSGKKLSPDWINCAASEAHTESGDEGEKCSYLCRDGQPRWSRGTLYRTPGRPTCSSFLAGATWEQNRVDQNTSNSEPNTLFHPRKCSKLLTSFPREDHSLNPCFLSPEMTIRIA